MNILRKFHYQLIGWALLCLACHFPSSTQTDKSNEAHDPWVINTVKGPVPADQLGLCLPHEHIMSNFGAEAAKVAAYDEQALFAQIIPYLRTLKSKGVSSIFDCTTAYFGRRVDLLQSISDSTGIHIITNTGFYGAANDRYVPEFVHEASVDQIAAHWIKECKEGIDGSDIKPGFIKLAFDSGPSSEVDSKLFKAGLQTHLETGLTLAVHTGDNPEAVALQLQLLEESGIHPSAWIWVHANKAKDLETWLTLAKKGAWISLDGVKQNNIQEFLDWLVQFKAADLLHKVLLSHDGNGFPRGGAIRPFEAIMNTLIPELKKRGFSDKEIELLTHDNPLSAFGIKVRRTGGDE